jgi:hypothetical protein
MASGRKRSDKLFAPRAIEDIAAFTRDELHALAAHGLRHGRSLAASRQARADKEEAEAFRRRLAVVWIFKGLSEQLRKSPAGGAAKRAVLKRLRGLGIACSNATLARDYRYLGGAKWLREIKPFAPDEDKTFVLA